MRAIGSISAGAINPSTATFSIPLLTATLFERDADGSFCSSLAYKRDANPMRGAFEPTQALSGLRCNCRGPFRNYNVPTIR
jgi:hypothetical protein